MNQNDNNPLTRAVFLDRDGVINRDRKYTYQSHRFEFLPGALDGLAALAPGFLKIIVTNQSGIARGYYTENDFRELNRWLLSVLNQLKIKIDDIIYCPHHPDEECLCRKPKIGMLLKSKQKYDIDLKRSFFIGDMDSDMLTGRNAGCATILIRDSENNLNDGAEQHADYIVDSLLKAAEIINNSSISDIMEV
ncbi:MAG: D,D-heptose 1,7-bisphosphate phosphatase [candidate division Zixibacteria bacterium CG_4_9_14_3_um_filter_46_8]|nr:MAG: D,D-heptose 1,7-bisphosphate phosphatase [candidate division Zixibacteria bacterium CG_4_9_14_3_um_filter_46_8]